MDPITLLSIALAPGIFWLWYFYKKDRYDPEPKKLIIYTFLLGALVTIPAGIINSIFISSSFENMGILMKFFAAFVVIGPVEEISKYMAMRLYALKSKEFDEPIDAMLYSVVAALGFATFENFLYISQYGASLILMRAITGCLGHAGFSGIVGYYVGKAKFSSPKNNNLVYKGLAIAAFSHGLFDFVLFTQTILALLFIPLLIVLIYFLSKRLGEMSSASPFKPSDNYDFKCPKCKKKVLSSSNFCAECGYKFKR
jgi:RsiW-degrading membrane proteinase PrsW (M82 family)